MSINLAQWQAKFGSEDLTGSSRPKKEAAPREKLERMTLDLGVAYPVRVTNAKTVQSSRGDVQLQLSLAVHIDGGDAVGAATEWFTLPFQDSDMNLDKDVARKLTLRRRDDLVRILSKAIPAKCALYASKTGEGKEAVYVGFDGKAMTREDLNAREVQINQAALEFAEELHGHVGEVVEALKGCEFFLVKAENAKNPKYPYTNIYSNKPANLPVFEG